MAEPGSNASPVNGGQVRDTWFRGVRWGVRGYDAWQVDDLLGRVAAELDAGGSARPLIENATFRRRGYGRRYDIDAVDWFLDRFLIPLGRVGLGRIADDSWGDLSVAQGDRGTSEKYAFELQCDSAWRDFGQLPGTHLRWGKTAKGLTELRTAEQQTLASVRGLWRKTTFSAGGRSFSWQQMRAAESPSPAVAELLFRVARDGFGHYAENKRIRNILADRGIRFKSVLGLVDEVGIPILYTAGRNYERRACACIMFPDQHWLRFLVRGTVPANAIMTAVDQAGNRVARYRLTDKSGRQIGSWSWDSVEIILHPGQKLTDELGLAVALSADWGRQYFNAGQ